MPAFAHHIQALKLQQGDNIATRNHITYACFLDILLLGSNTVYYSGGKVLSPAQGLTPPLPLSSHGIPQVVMSLRQ